MWYFILGVIAIVSLFAVLAADCCVERSRRIKAEDEAYTMMNNYRQAANRASELSNEVMALKKQILSCDQRFQEIKARCKL